MKLVQACYFLSLCACSASAATGQITGPQKIGDLLATGYEVKTSTQATPQPWPIVILYLQKGPSLYGCSVLAAFASGVGSIRADPCVPVE
jgi:hypothetical protein